MGGYVGNGFLGFGKSFPDFLEDSIVFFGSQRKLRRMSLIDSHCHLEKFAKAGNLKAILDRAVESDVKRLITVGTDASDWGLYRDLAKAYPDMIAYTVGIHPCSVDAKWREQAQAVSSFFIPPVAPVALGEIGLDYFHLPQDEKEAAELVEFQKDAFRFQLDIAYQLDCPVVVHSRHAFKDCVDMIDESGVDWARVVFHCFSEGPESMQQILERGGYGSFTGIITYKSAEDVREAAKLQGVDRLMLETDCPYLTPVPHRGKPNEPAYLKHTAAYVADMFGITEQALAEKTSQRVCAFFDLD
ncbi:MAG: TatD family hydrolase [Opitutales bacterium]